MQFFFPGGYDPSQVTELKAFRGVEFSLPIMPDSQ